MNTAQKYEKILPTRLISGIMFPGVSVYCGYDTSNCPVLFIQINKTSYKSYQKCIYDKILDHSGFLRAHEKNHFNRTDTDYIYRISGRRGVEEALYVLLEKADIYSGWSYPERCSLKKKIIHFRSQLVKEIAAKNNKKSPLQKVKRESDYCNYQPVNIISLNEVNQVTNIKETKSYFLKSTVGAINELAAFNSELFVLLLGKHRVGRVRSVQDADGMRRGSASRAIDGFQSLISCLQQHNNNIINAPFVDRLINSGYASVEVANLVYAENDAHWDNVCLNSKGQISRIDFDQTNWMLTCVYADCSPYERFDEELPPPCFAFPVTETDAVNLPLLTCSAPYCGLADELRWRQASHFLLKMQKSPQFRNEKWRTFLKYLLLGEQIFHTLADKCFSSAQRKKEVLTYVLHRRKEFYRMLARNNEFQQYLENNPKEKYLINYELRLLGVGTDVVDNEWNDLLKKIYNNQLTAKYRAEEHLYTAHLKAVYGESADFCVNYNGSVLITVPNGTQLDFLISEKTIKTSGKNMIQFEVAVLKIDAVFSRINGLKLPLMNNDIVLKTFPAIVIWKEIFNLFKKFLAFQNIKHCNPNKEQLQKDIVNRCHYYLSSKYRGGFFKGNELTSTLKLLYTSVVRCAENIKINPQICNLEQLLILQQKQEVIDQLTKAIKRLESHKNPIINSCEEKINAYRIFIEKILLSSQNKSVLDVWTAMVSGQQDVVKTLKSIRGSGMLTATSVKILHKLMVLPKPAEIVLLLSVDPTVKEYESASASVSM